MEWTSGGAMQSQADSMGPSDYIGAVGRSREADLCFKVCSGGVIHTPVMDSQPF